MEGHIQTCVYQAQWLHKGVSQPLHVVILAKTNPRTQARAHVILLSSDLARAYTLLVDYYSLRFQIEIGLRDSSLAAAPQCEWQGHGRQPSMHRSFFTVNWVR